MPGQDVRVYLSPEESSDVGMGLRGLGGWVSTPPSRLGIIIDARGRPIRLPLTPGQGEKRGLIGCGSWEPEMKKLLSRKTSL